MRTIFVNTNTFECYVENDGTRIAVETDAFDGKCDAFVEGYRYIPSGESWTRSDGVVFHGEMIAPYKDYALLEMAQSLYEETLVDKERITALEEDNKILKEDNAMLTECVLELSSIIYA